MREYLKTLNPFEAGQLAQTGPISEVEEMEKVAKIIIESGAKNVVIKGGTALNFDQATDLFYDGN